MDHTRTKTILRYIARRLAANFFLTILLLPGIAARAADETSVWYTNTLESADGQFFVTLEATEADFALNDFRTWHISLRDKATGKGVSPARFTVSGGMPMHGHGLPSQPKVTNHLGEGRYLLEGVRFNMLGKWVLQIDFTTSEGSDSATFEVVVDY